MRSHDSGHGNTCRRRTLAQRDRERIDEAILRAAERIKALRVANASRASDLRDQSIAYLEGFIQLLLKKGVYDKIDFEKEEIDALFGTCES